MVIKLSTNVLKRSRNSRGTVAERARNMIPFLGGGPFNISLGWPPPPYQPLYAYSMRSCSTLYCFFTKHVHISKVCPVLRVRCNGGHTAPYIPKTVTTPNDYIFDNVGIVSHMPSHGRFSFLTSTLPPPRRAVMWMCSTMPKRISRTST